MATKAVDVVTWQDAEDALLEVMGLDRLMPDRERGFLAAGSRSTMPQPVRSVRDGEYPEATGRRGLRAAEVDRINGLGHVVASLAGSAAGLDTLLVRKVLTAKLAERGGGFTWDVIWQWDDQRRRAARMPRRTQDAVRMAYRRAVAAVAVALDKLPADRRDAILGLRAQ